MSIQCKRCYWISCKEGHQDGICKDCLNELKIQDLERQLAEAREEVEMLKDIKERMFEMLNLAYCNHDGFKPLFESLCKMIKEQLKEQG